MSSCVNITTIAKGNCTNVANFAIILSAISKISRATISIFRIPKMIAIPKTIGFMNSFYDPIIHAMTLYSLYSETEKDLKYIYPTLSLDKNARIATL